MIYKDRIYGKIKIEEPVILELIKSKSLQRLKGIDQGGYAPLYYNPRNLSLKEIDHRRFEHSLGVYYLLKRFGAGLEEQIAGLIHDVSHSIFSHCIDYVLKVGSQKKHNHQDNIFRKFVEKTEIPKILERYNFNKDYILDEKNFPLKERALPELCADRLDYSLRTAIIFKEIDRQNLDYFLNSLIVRENNWIFKNLESAKRYARLFLKMNTFYYSGLYSAVMFSTVGNTLRYSLKNNYISERDLYSTDKKVLNKIRKYLKKDKKLKLFFSRMNGKIRFKNDLRRYDSHIFCKSRIVDPLFITNGRIKRLSGADSKWKKLTEKELKPKEYFVKFEK